MFIFDETFTFIFDQFNWLSINYQIIKSENDFIWYFQTEFLIKNYFSSEEVLKISLIIGIVLL